MSFEDLEIWQETRGLLKAEIILLKTADSKNDLN